MQQRQASESKRQGRQAPCAHCSCTLEAGGSLAADHDDACQRKCEVFSPPLHERLAAPAVPAGLFMPPQAAAWEHGRQAGTFDAPTCRVLVVLK